MKSNEWLEDSTSMQIPGSDSLRADACGRERAECRVRTRGMLSLSRLPSQCETACRASTA